MKKLILLISVFVSFSNVRAQTEDCNGVINGPAVLDDCGTCQLAYLYNTITHSVTFLNSTDGINTGSNEMLVLPENIGNPYWNDCGENYDVDCNNIVKGPALIDTCNICRKAYVYNTITHEVTFINHEDLHELVDNEIIVAPNSETNPYWNDCSVSTVLNLTKGKPKKVLKRVDLFGNNLNQIKPNTVFIEFYNDGTHKKKLIVQ